jgi:hypothetical protein
MKESGALDRDQGAVIIDYLHELVVWTKLVHRTHVAEWFTRILDSEEKRFVYQYSDGERSVRELGDLAGVSKALISAWWRDWDQLGIMEQSRRVPGRRRRMVSLDELGIEVPALSETEGE